MHVAGKELHLELLPATSDRLAPSKCTGLPSWVGKEPASGGSEAGSVSLESDGQRDVEINRSVALARVWDNFWSIVGL